MGIACNLMTALELRQIFSGYRNNIEPFPRTGLPGGVQPSLQLYLAGLSKDYVQNVFMHGQLLQAKKPISHVLTPCVTPTKATNR